MSDPVSAPSPASRFSTLGKARQVFESIRSFADIERLFLRGQGLSPHTYRSYLTAVKQLYQFTGGLTPLQITAADIELFYDDLSLRVGIDTAYLRIAGLRKFFRGVSRRLPWFSSPFDGIPDALHKKLSRTSRQYQTRKALSATELHRLLEWLDDQEGLLGAVNHAVVFMLATSGLRAAELLSIRWRAIERVDATWTAHFHAKGGQASSQELYAPALDSTRISFERQFHRAPTGDEHLFYTVPRHVGEEARPLPYHALWYRLRRVGERAVQERVLTREVILSPHLFRRSYATLLYSSGMGIKGVQKKTRHSSVDTLLQHYIADETPAKPLLDVALGVNRVQGT